MIKIEKLTNTTAPIFLIFGGEGEGKTTLASKFSKSIWMPLERGLPAGVEVDAIRLRHQRANEILVSTKGG